jgi:hypothetical protein
MRDLGLGILLALWAAATVAMLRTEPRPSPVSIDFPAVRQ